MSNQNCDLDYVEDVSAFLLQHPVHLRVVGDDHLVLHVCLGRGDAELDEGDLGFVHLGGSAHVLRLLAENQTFHQRTVFHDATQLLHYLHVSQIHLKVIKKHASKNLLTGGQRIRIHSLLNVFNVLIYEISSKFAMNCIKTSQVRMRIIGIFV